MLSVVVTHRAQDPPIWAGAHSMPITRMEVQIRAFCAVKGGVSK
jgi:hypothetical protein